MTDQPHSPERPGALEAGVDPAASETEGPTVSAPVTAAPDVGAATKPSAPSVTGLSSAGAYSAPTWDAPRPVPAPEVDTASTLAERPELAVGAAFAGGLVLAMILKRVAR